MRLSHRFPLLSRRLFWACALSWSLAAWVSAESPPVVRHWVVLLGTEAVGSYSETTASLPEGGQRTQETMRITLKRLGAEIRLSMTSETDENAAGEMTGLQSSMALGSEPTKTRVRREGQTLLVTTESGGRSYEKKLTTSERLLGPNGVVRLSREKLKAAGDSIRYHEFTSDSVSVNEVQRTVLSRREGELEVEESSDGVPLKNLVVLGADGNWLRRKVPLPFGELSIAPASAEAAQRAEAGGNLPETFDRTVVRSHIRLPDPRSISRVKLRLKLRAATSGWPDLALPQQRVTNAPDGSRVLLVRRFEQGLPGPAPEAEFRDPNALVQSDDAEVIRLAREITAGVRPDREKALRLQDWVNRNLQVDFGIGLASASEVARNRRGSCVAASVLLAAMQRAVGLPSRVAMGYVYFAGCWGGHAWTEVYVDGRWLSLDAAVYAPGATDAARISLGASSGEDQLADLGSAALQLFGNLEIRVEEYVLAGRTVRIPAGAAGQSVQGAEYVNPWLGFALTAPAGFEIGGLDAIFPETTVLTLKDAAGTLVRIAQGGVQAPDPRSAAAAEEDSRNKPLALGGRQAAVFHGPKESRLVFRRGHELWTITATGPGAAAALTATAAAWRWRP